MDGAAMQIGRNARTTDRAPAWLLTLPLLASLAGCMQPPPPAAANLPPLPPPNVQIVAPQPPPPAQAETVEIGAESVPFAVPIAEPVDDSVSER